MSDINNIITNNIDIWTSAIEKKKAVGRGSSKKHTLYGIKKLRELILDLAVRGKLVPQDPIDEPASVLLEKIKAEKEQLIKDKKIKKQKGLPDITDDEKPFDIPDNWEWCRLGDVTNYGVSDKVTSDNVDLETLVIELEDIEKETSKVLKKVRFKDRNFKSTKSVFRKGDLLYGKLRPYLDKVVVADEDGVCTTEIIPFKAFKSISSHYLRIILKSPYFKELANNSTHGMNLPRLGIDKARIILLPITSENEQKRIVSKVNELMTLCDKLEQQTEDSITAHKTLVEVLLNTLTESKDHNELTTNWNRISEHFDSLFTTKESIDLLKQTILQLAIMGKLVPQDPTDEPASELLKRITAEKEQLIKDKKIKKPKKLPEITDEEKLFDIPEGWKWIYINDLGHDWGQKKPDKDFSYIDVSSINKELGIIENPSILQAEMAPSRARKIVKDNTVIYSTVRPYLLNIAIVDECFDAEPIASTAFAIINPFTGISSIYVYQYLRSPIFVEYVESTQNGVAYPAINDKQFFSGLIPLPPENEQKRIVSKVNELMTLCDELTHKLQLERESKVLISDAIVKLLV